MPPRPTIATVGPRRASRHLILAGAVVVTTFSVTACSEARNVTITSPCETDVLVDWVYRSHGGADVVQENAVIEAGEHVYADALETEYIALMAGDEVLAETSLPADQLDADGANPFPPMSLPAEACSRLTPAPASDSGESGY